MLKKPSALFPILNWPKDVPTRTKGDSLQDAASFLQKLIPAAHWDNWELGHLLPVCAVKYKQHCCDMKTLWADG